MISGQILGETGRTRLQVTELCQRSHLQMLQVKSVSLPAGQIPHNMFIDHAHTSKPHQGTKQQRHLEEAQLKPHSVTAACKENKKEDTRSYLCFIDAFDIWGREVGVDLVDVLLVHVLGYAVLIKVVHHVGARQHAVHLKPND